jgi:hypothetical protein
VTEIMLPAPGYGSHLTRDGRLERLRTPSGETSGNLNAITAPGIETYGNPAE